MKKSGKFKKISAFDIVVYGISIMLVAIVLYPLILVLSSSVSDPVAVAAGEVIFLPKGFTLDGYKIEDPVILNRRFQANDGSIAEFFVNRTFCEQKLKLHVSSDARLYRNLDEYSSVSEEIVLAPGEICCIIN